MNRFTSRRSLKKRIKTINNSMQVLIAVNDFHLSMLRSEVDTLKRKNSKLVEELKREKAMNDFDKSLKDYSKKKREEEKHNYKEREYFKEPSKKYTNTTPAKCGVTNCTICGNDK